MAAAWRQGLSRAAGFPERTLLLTLLVVPLLFALNFLANHLWEPPGERVGYYLLVTLAAGTLLPAVALHWLALGGAADLRQWGYAVRSQEFLKIGAAFAAAAVIAAFPIGGHVLREPGRALHLLVWLFTTSLAEVLVFLGILYNVSQALLARSLPRWGAMLLATLLASASFGLYHFSYSPPWNTPAMALKLSGVWLEVTVVFLLTRSLWAAAVFNTVMGVIGFVLNEVTRLDREPLAIGFLLAGVSLLAVAGVAWAFRRVGVSRA